MVRTRPFIVVGMLTGLAIAASRAERPLKEPRLPAPGQPTLSVISYNVNYGLAGDEPTLDAIAKRPSDLVLLQETTPVWEEALRTRFSDAYPHIAFRHCCLAGGLGVLSRYPFEELEYIEPPDGGWFPGWLLGVESPLGRLQVLNVHLRPQIGDGGPNVVGVVSGQFTTPSIRKKQIEHYASHLKRGVPTLIVGDFNESEHGAAMSWLEARGFHSAVPDFTRSDTWSWQTSFGRVARRFDHIVHSREITALSAGVLYAGRSDHLPTYALLGSSRHRVNPSQRRARSNPTSE